MKKIVGVIIACLLAGQLPAQKCLQLNIVALSAKLQPVGSGSSGFGECDTRKNDHDQTEIVDYGSGEKSLNDFLQRTTMDFQSAQLGANAAQMANGQAMAAQMQNMSAEQKQAYAMQMAAQMRANAMQAKGGADNPQNVKLAMQAYSIAGTQMPPLVNELSAKFRDLIDRQKKEEDAVKQPDLSQQCPPEGKVGMPGCGCANGAYESYWTKILSIRDSYATQKNQLLDQYLPRLKAMAGTIDDAIVKLKYGDALINPQYKKMLAGAQSSAFGNIFAVPESIIEDVRHTGAQAYVNKLNAKDKVYFLGCQR